MSQVSIQPLLRAMVVHKSPAVRFFGWTAYTQLRTNALAHGAMASKPMFEALKTSAARETDLYVLAELIRVLRLPLRGEAVITPEAYNAAQDRSYQILRSIWPALCRAMLTGRAAAADAATMGLETAKVLHDGLGDGADKKVALQLAADVAWHAGAAFDLAQRWDKALEEAKASAGEAGEADLDAETAAKLEAIAKSLGADARDLPGLTTEVEYASSSNAKLLQLC